VSRVLTRDGAPFALVVTDEDLIVETVDAGFDPLHVAGEVEEGGKVGDGEKAEIVG
jgi:hypothetical protein